MTTVNSLPMHNTNDYIRRGDAIDAVYERILQIGYEKDTSVLSIRQAVRDVAPSDVVSRDAFNRILAENDTMRAQLSEIGKKPGDEMSDVMRITEDRWVDTGESKRPEERWECPVCGEKCKETVMWLPRWNFCPMCGTYLENNL